MSQSPIRPESNHSVNHTENHFDKNPAVYREEHPEILSKSEHHSEPAKDEEDST